MEFSITGDEALWAQPQFSAVKDVITYPVPTYDGMRGVADMIAWKRTYVNRIIAIRVMSEIKYSSRMLNYGSEPKFFQFLIRPCYQVKTDFVWNDQAIDLVADRNQKKHEEMQQRYLARGGKMNNIYLGNRKCGSLNNVIEPCAFGSGIGFYDGSGTIQLGKMIRCREYATDGTILGRRYFDAVMNDGCIVFPKPKDCAFEKVSK